VSDERRNPAQPTRRAAGRTGGRRISDEPPDWLSPSAYAYRYGVSRATVYKWLRAKILHVYQVGTLQRIRNLPPDQHPASRPASSTDALPR